MSLAEIAASYGTPAYVLDEADVRQRCRGYRQAFGDAEIAYAGKAFLCRAMVRWVDEEGLSLDVCSEGELAVASCGVAATGFCCTETRRHPATCGPRWPTVSGGSCWTRPGRSPGSRRWPRSRPRQRSAGPGHPGVDAHAPGGGHRRRGPEVRLPSLSTGAAADAVRRILAQPELELAGLHCHLGSQITRPEAFEAAVRRWWLALEAVHAEHGVTLPELNLGGGHGVPYTEDDQDFDLAGFAARIRTAVRGACASLRLPVLRITVEPGRAIISRARSRCTGSSALSMSPACARSWPSTAG